MRKEKHQTVIATEENVQEFIKSDVSLMADTMRQLGGKMEFNHAMDMLHEKFGDSISEELMDKVNKELEEYGIIR